MYTRDEGYIMLGFFLKKYATPTRSHVDIDI